MATSIGKLSKSFFVKLLVGIIILPFVFWGMGDVFRGGNQNVIATIDSKKISTQEFVDHLRKLNLDEEQIKNLPQTNLIEQILSEYIGRKVMALEIEKSGISINDNSLRDIIKSDKLFFKDNKFSRTEYEKFLLKSGLTAPNFENNIAEQESKRQFLDFISNGIVVPNILIIEAFNKENQIKTIRYIDLEKYYANFKPSKNEINEMYNKNKDSLIEEFKSIQYTEITPQDLSGSSEYNDSFFKQLDILENKILDGQTFEETSKENNFKIIVIEDINRNKKNRNKEKVKDLSDDIFKKIYPIKNEKNPQVLKIGGKYYLAEIISIFKENKSIDDPDVIKLINAQLKFKYKIEFNTSIAKDLSLGGFDKIKIEKFATENNLELKNYEITNLKQNEIFSEGIIKRIFKTKDGDVDLITDSNLTKNFLILGVNTQYKTLDEKSKQFEQYKAKARLNLINNIFKTYDEDLNKKYKVQLNKKTVDRVKNSF